MNTEKNTSISSVFSDGKIRKNQDCPQMVPQVMITVTIDAVKVRKGGCLTKRQPPKKAKARLLRRAGFWRII